MNHIVLVIGCFILVTFVFIFTLLLIIKKRRIKSYRLLIEELDTEKNEIDSAQVVNELAKIETLVKTEKMEEKYKSWFDTYDSVKNELIPLINDKIIDLDVYLDTKDLDNFSKNIALTELEIYKAKETLEDLMNSINELNTSEEKYRTVITKLKNKYRELQTIFEEKKNEYEDIASVIELQFENIEKRFQDFEDCMEVNDYQEVYHIVKGIDIMISHMEIVVDEVPDLVLLANRLIPKKIEQITEIYDDLKKKKYPLKHLKIEYNVEESLKNVNQIIDRIKVLNLENCMFELKTMLEYLESLFEEFELEKQAKKEYDDNKEIIDKKLDKTNKVVEDIYLQLDDIKNMYDLSINDVEIIDGINTRLKDLNDAYTTTCKDLSKKKIPYSTAVDNLEGYAVKLNTVEEELDSALKNLGNMYEDEERAREQLDEIQRLLKQSKSNIKSYKLPIISNNYFVELQEANDAIYEIIKELEKKPIVIKTLNTRVDTARDLVLKLYNNTSEMIKSAKLAEYSIVYGNRYRSQNLNVDSGLNQAQMLFYKGNYKKALDVTLTTLERVDKDIRKRVMDIYEKIN